MPCNRNLGTFERGRAAVVFRGELEEVGVSRCTACQRSRVPRRTRRSWTKAPARQNRKGHAVIGSRHNFRLLGKSSVQDLEWKDDSFPQYLAQPCQRTGPDDRQTTERRSDARGNRHARGPAPGAQPNGTWRLRRRRRRNRALDSLWRGNRTTGNLASCSAGRAERRAETT